MKTQRGYSLIELLGVVALIGICGVVGVRSLSLPTTAAGEARRLLTALDAVEVAANRRTVAVLCWISSGELYCNESGGSAPFFQERFVAELRPSYGFVPEGQNLIPPATLAFYPDGTVTPGRIRVEFKGGRCTLFQSLRGRRRLSCE